MPPLAIAPSSVRRKLNRATARRTELQLK
jgi:hypothetical protein